jgi:hypothetical protein
MAKASAITTPIPNIGMRAGLFRGAGLFSWLVWGILATIGWGVAPVFLRLSPVSVWIRQTIVGAMNVAVCLVGLAVETRNAEPGAFAAEWSTLVDPWTAASAVGYSTMSIAGSLTFLTGQRVENAPLTLLNAMTSSYSIITTALLFAIYHEYTKLNLALAVPGLLLIVVGLVLLALSPK